VQESSRELGGATVASGQEYRPAYERVVDEIIVLISSRDLKPGDRLPTETELATELGTSQRTVRDALKMLSAIGRVKAERGRGLFVGRGTESLRGAHPVPFRPTDMDQIAALFRFRAVQERESARLAASHAAPMEVRALDDALQLGREAAERRDWTAFTRSDERFHTALAESSHNIFFVDAVVRIRELQAQVSFLELGQDVTDAERAIREHSEILEAIRDGDSELAGERAAHHVRRSLEDYRFEIERRLLALNETA
jgi:GntR family transcriptional repressor for pyruvate dehydrogenase complex